MAKSSLPIERWHEGISEPDLFGSLNLQPVRLSIVGQVVEESAAQRAGLQTGDWIVAVDGERVSRWSEWVDHIVDSPGRAMEFEVLREGRRIYMTAVADSVMTAETVLRLVGWVLLRLRKRFSPVHLTPSRSALQKRGI